MLRSLAIVLAAAHLLCVGARGDDPTDGGGKSPATIPALRDWLTAAGADLSGVEVGPGIKGHRGVHVSRRFVRGDTILRLPLNKAINIGPMSVSSSMAAVKLLREMHKKSSRRLPFVQSLPPMGDCTNVDMWPAKAWALLPEPLAEAAIKRRAQAWKVFTQSVRGRARAYGGHAVTWPEFLHAVCLVSSRALAVARGHGKGDVVKFLVPFLDLVNHDARRGAPNTIRLVADDTSVTTPSPQGPTHIELVAGATLSVGDEVFISYGSDLTPDETISQFGFVDTVIDVAGSMTSSSSTPPFLLCTHDQPDTPAQLGNKAEISRLQGLVEAVRVRLLTPEPEMELGGNDDNDDNDGNNKLLSDVTDASGRSLAVAAYWHARRQLLLNAIHTHRAHGTLSSTGAHDGDL